MFVLLRAEEWWWFLPVFRGTGMGSAAALGCASSVLWPRGPHVMSWEPTLSSGVCWWESHEQDFAGKKKKEWCIFTADIYTAFTTKSALNSCSACHVGPKSMALPQDSCIWGDFPVLNMRRCWVLGSCNTALPQQLNSCTEGTRAFPKKTPNKSLKWGAWREEGIEFLNWSAMCCENPSLIG